ncbi:MAG: hypothetical protein M1832_005310 [Thelocarpon impressellum]|nr:MAG: hypothetical protein M1832_005310 [Thelocarpon impressellum]
MASLSPPPSDSPVHENVVSPAQRIRPSPLNGHPTTSTGVPSLDALLAGHAGLPLGASVLLEEGGATDFAGALLRCYAAEGVCQGHAVHVVGVGREWSATLPGLGAEGDRRGGREGDAEKMKIAWRYEGLGEFGSGTGVMGRRGAPSSPAAGPATPPFCHVFDLAKRLAIPSPSPLHFIPVSSADDPFASVLDALSTSLSSATPTTHRLVIPSLLSPGLYPAHASRPHLLLGFLHALRALLREHAGRLTAMLSLPLALHPRASGLVRWAELLCDGVLELAPFAHLDDAAHEERPQGMLRIHSLPLFHERGGGAAGGGNVGHDLAFTLSRRRFAIRPYSLPPVDGDVEAQEGAKSKTDLEF